MASRTTKSDLEEITNRLQRMTDVELRLRSTGGGRGATPTYELAEVLQSGGEKRIVRAQGAGRMERALRGFEKGLRY